MFASSQAKNAASLISPYLMTSARPARSSRVGQRAQRVGIRDHRARLMKGADQILAARMIDPGLAAHRGIHLRQQRGGHLHVIDAPLVAGGREAGHVADDPAASATSVQSRLKRLATSTSMSRATLASVLCASPSGSVASTTRRVGSAAINAAA